MRCTAPAECICSAARAAAGPPYHQRVSDVTVASFVTLVLHLRPYLFVSEG